MVERLQKVKQIEFSRFALRDRPKELGATTLAAGDCWANVSAPTRLPLTPFAECDASIECGRVGGQRDRKVRRLSFFPLTVPSSFIDWQIAMEGNPVFDLARLTVLCADAEVRRAVEAELVPAYFEELERASSPDRPPFTREQVSKKTDGFN